MKFLRSILPNPWKRRQRAPSDLFDILHASTVSAVGGSHGRLLGAWSTDDAAAAETAPRFIFGLWRAQSTLRRRFPRASTQGGGYRQWLLTEGAVINGVNPQHLTNIAEAFAADPGEKIWQFYLHSPEIQERFPLALLPVGQKRFLKWLIGKGTSRYGFSDEAILWFLHQSAETLARGITQTYLIRPEWQRRFPDALSPGNQTKFLKSLRAEFSKYSPLRAVGGLRASVPVSSRGVNLLAHFCYPSGLQRAALSVKSAFESVEIATSCRDVPAGVQTELTDRSRWLGLEVFPVSLLGIAPVPHFANCYSRAGLDRRRGVYRIALWYWELENVPVQWKEFAGLVDEIWAPTPFIAASMRATMPVPVYEMLPAVPLGPIEHIQRSCLGIPEESFLFLFMFDMCSDMERKNPLGLIRAFRHAFSPGENAVLLIKTMRTEADPEGWARLQSVAQENQVQLLNELMPESRAMGLIAGADCFVSLHRAEGFGLGLAEAMLMGKPVVATGYSGNLAFMNRRNSLLVDYKTVPLETCGPIYKSGSRWAEPSEEHAAVLMRQVFHHRDHAIHQAKIAQAELMANLSLEAAGGRMKNRLDEIGKERLGAAREKKGSNPPRRCAPEPS